MTVSVHNDVRDLPLSRQASLGAILRDPAGLLVVLSLLFGPALILLNPPLRGPDEPAHFLRVYAYTQGVILPRAEVDGRQGIHLPASLHEEFSLYQSHTASIWKPGFTFRSVLREHQALLDQQPADPRPDRVFAPFEGSESYTIVAYAPYVIAGLVARWAGLGFVDNLVLMRFAGLVAFTAVAVYAVAMTPYLKWAFFLIAMLPAALYGRSVVGADAATVSFSLVVVALALRSVARLQVRTWERALWMPLCVLAKPPQIAFILLEPMIHRFKDWRRRWRIIVAVVAPGVVLSLAWIWAVDAEIAAWRIFADSGQPREHFSLTWKFGYMLENPGHFPRAMFATLFGEAFGLWRQIIGVLGWLDTHFHVGVYTALSIAFLLTTFTPLNLPSSARLPIAFYSLAIVALYTVAVFLILFITWTPPEESVVWGVQGRYFVVVLPLIAIFVASLTNLALPPMLVVGASVSGAILSSVACVEALWRVNWVGH